MTDLDNTGKTSESDDFDRAMMRRAIELSQTKMNEGYGGPFAAVITRAGNVLAEGFNAVTSSNDPTAHAEIMAIRKACEKEATFSLEHCTIYTSCEPCPMCLAAIYWARIERIVYANSRLDAARIGFDDEFIYHEISRPLADRKITTERLLAEDAMKVFQNWQQKTDKIAY